MREKLNREDIAAHLRSFYMGRYYPVLVCLLTFLGSVTGTEIFLNFFLTALFVGACVLCDTVRPIIINVCLLVLQISPAHSPVVMNGDGGKYLFTSWRFVLVIIYVALLICSAIFFFVKNKCYKRMNIKRDILLLPIIVLCCAFLLGGAFSDAFSLMNLLFALAQAAIFALIYFLFFYGFSERESRTELAGYMSYISALIAGVIIAQLCVLFLTSDNVFVNGSFNKVGVVLGWGIWTLIGAMLSMLIPAIFYGAMTSKKYWWAYFGAATLAWGFSVLSQSRAALVFATLAYAACIVICAFKSEHKLLFRGIAVVGVIGVLLGLILFHDKLAEALAGFLDGNGRAEHWEIAIKNFLDYSVFGRGFSGFQEKYKLPAFYAPMGPMPALAHNTVMTLLSATGIVGLLAYLFYRAASAVPVFKKPTLDKTMLALSVLTLLLASMLDNFIFDFYPAFYVMALTAVIHKRDVPNTVESGDPC